MNRAQFDHVVRAAGAILGENEILVIGSQAIHASTDRLFPEAERSIEVDVVPLGDRDGRRADLIDGSIGELSLFQETFGYYAQGVSLDTAVLPDGWRDRVIRYESPATNGVVALCLEPHDLWVAKAIAGRAKDRAFCDAMRCRGLVASACLHERLASLRDVDEAIVHRAASWIASSP